MSNVGLGDVLKALVYAEKCTAQSELSADQERALGALFGYEYLEPEQKQAQPHSENQALYRDKPRVPTTEEVAPTYAPVPLLRLVQQKTVELDEPAPAASGAKPFEVRRFKPVDRHRPCAPARWTISELAPHLYSAMSVREPVAGVDKRILVRRLSRVEPMTQLPRAMRRRMVPRIRVILDRSFALTPSWSDGDLVSEWLKQWGPSHGVEVVHTRWGASDWPEPEAGLTTITVSDAGRFAHPIARSSNWVEEGFRRVEAGERALLLTLSSGSEDLVGWERVGVEREASLSEHSKKNYAECVLALASLAIQVEGQLLRALRLTLGLSHPDIELWAWQRTDAFDSDVTSIAQWAPEVFKKYRKRLVDASHAPSWLSPSLLKKALHTIARFRVEVSGEGSSKKTHFWTSEAIWHMELASWRNLSGQLSPEFAGVIESFISEENWLEPNHDYLESLRVSAFSTSPSNIRDPLRRPRLKLWFHRLRQYEDPSAWMSSSGVFHGLAKVLSGADMSLRIQHTSAGLELVDKASTPGSPLVTLPSGEPAVTWALAEQQTAFWAGEILPTKLRDWKEATLKPSWAHRAGRDMYGVWASVDIRGVELKMRWIEPGTFWMGAGEDDWIDVPKNELPLVENEKPRHQVTLTEGYWLAETACSQALWEALTGQNPSGFKGADRPVENVTWEDIQSALSELNHRMPGLELRLPTEAQWEYACRAGTETARYGELEAIAWYDDNSGGDTHPMKQKAPNAWGLYDMLGNVWEWCQDWYGPYSDAPTIDPTGPREGVLRVLRGGSWYDSARHVRAASRDRFVPASRLSLYGFRLSRGHGAPSQPGTRGPEGLGQGRSGERGDRASEVPTNSALGMHPPGPRITLATDRAISQLDIWERPSWASYVGRDEYGLFAMVSVGEPIPVSFRMRWIPPGTFWMGSPEGEEGRYDDEVRHRVRLTEGYWLGETPCTQGLWKAVNGDNPSEFNGDEHPVEKVSWDDAQTFLQKLNALRPGLDAGLPTEAQWEYACRAGTQEARYGELEAVAWYDENASDSTHPVGLKAPNAWGLHDMLGNVWEWCQDYYDDYQVVGDVTENPVGPSKGVYRVLRGGSWYDSAQSVRAACRSPLVPALGLSSCGFRLSRGHGAPSKKETGPGGAPSLRGTRRLSDDRREERSAPEGRTFASRISGFFRRKS